MRAEVVAVGTELLLGQIVDTNSTRIAQLLAESGIDCHFQTRVGDNEARIAEAVGVALQRAEAVVVCGGLGPTPDDVTREGLSRVLGVPLVRDPAMEERIRSIFAARGRDMPASNLRQADRPVGARFILQERGTAPGLVCEAHGGRVIYAVPGVPYEMEDMLESAVMADLRHRSGGAVIRSRVVRTWGMSEAAVAERIAPLVDAQVNPTIAFLARGMLGIHVRVTARARTVEQATAMLAAGEAQVRSLLGDVVFGVDDESMEAVVARLLGERGLTLAVAESLTGGLVASLLVGVEGASGWFRGAVVAYDADVKRSVLGVGSGPVVSAEAAAAMAEGAARVMGAEVGLGVTGVAGPDTQGGRPVGTVFAAVATGRRTEVASLRLAGDRHRIRENAAVSALDLLRRRLLEEG